MAYGQNAKNGIGFQNSYGTAAATGSLFYVPILSESVKKEIPELLSESMRGIFEEGDSYAGPNKVSGDLEMEATPLNLGLVLGCTLEQTALVTSGSVYTRTYKPRQTDWDSKSAGRPFTFYKDLGVGSAHLFADLNASGFELSVTNGELLKCKLSVVGGTYTQTAAVSSPSYPSERAFTWDVTSVGIAGTANADVQALTLKYSEGVEAKHTLNNSRDPSNTKHSGVRTLEVSGTILFTDQTEYQAYLAQSERRLLVHFQGSTAIQSGYYPGLTIDIPSLRYTDFPLTAGGPGEIAVGFTAKAKYNAGSGSLLAITHRSSQAAI